MSYSRRMPMLLSGAEYGRVARRNGYRHPNLDTRVRALDDTIPKLRTGTYFPEWLRRRRKRSESALATVVTGCYLVGVSTRRTPPAARRALPTVGDTPKLIKTLDILSFSNSRASRMAADLDEHVEQFHHPPLEEAGPLTFISADALTMKVRESGRMIQAVALLATGVNGDRHQEAIGMPVATSETGATWNSFSANRVSRCCGA